MTNKSRNCSVLSLALVASLLAACGSEQKPTEPSPVKDTAFGDMAGTVDKARAVEGQVQDSKAAIDRALDQNENSTAQ
ncbi:hypothetical protein [Peristeroidobacter soli]|jgi:hypothetical protein|uniref:hypothetical protein n=1 Tax=Peristeroidobacter soli TaxID=2497877 RepID=UPI00101DC27B|nr:hypothetical protein [Peristeroidobacter soli]